MRRLGIPHFVRRAGNAHVPHPVNISAPERSGPSAARRAQRSAYSSPHQLLRRPQMWPPTDAESQRNVRPRADGIGVLASSMPGTPSWPW